MLNNWEILLFCLHKTGGHRRFVDVEEVFLECYGTAPRRFSWRTCSLPDSEKCSEVLRYIFRRKQSYVTKSRDGFKVRLTVEGKRWLQANLPRLLESLARPGEDKGRLSLPARGADTRLIRSIEQSREFSTWRKTSTVPQEKWQIADIFMCSPDSSKGVWKSRLEILRNAADDAGRSDLLSFLDTIYLHHTGWFKDEVLRTPT